MIGGIVMIEYETHFDYGYLCLGRARDASGEIVVPDELDGCPVRRMEETFRDCHELTGVTLPSGLTEIGEALFSGCTGITRYEIGGQITAVLDRAFCACRNLVSVSVPSSVLTVGREAFYGCEKLKEIALPSVKELGAGAFYGCFSLETVSLGNGLTDLKCGVFGYCKALKEVRIPESVEQIDPYAFEYAGVSTVLIPEKLSGTVLKKCSAQIITY